jgi:hypothetical protein
VKARRARCAAGPGNNVCFGGEQLPDSGTPQKKQANIARAPASVVSFPARPRRLDVRITAADGRAPIGRSRAFRLAGPDLDELIDVALRMERAP